MRDPEHINFVTIFREPRSHFLSYYYYFVARTMGYVRAVFGSLLLDCSPLLFMRCLPEPNSLVSYVAMYGLMFGPPVMEIPPCLACSMLRSRYAHRAHPKHATPVHYTPVRRRLPRLEGTAHRSTEKTTTLPVRCIAHTHEKIPLIEVTNTKACASFAGDAKRVCSPSRLQGVHLLARTECCSRLLLGVFQALC